VRLRYTLPALADLSAILDYIAARSPRGARRVQARLQTIIDLLLQHPHIGRRTSDPAIRRISATPYPYLIFYEATEGEIVIHAIRTTARATHPRCPVPARPEVSDTRVHLATGAKKAARKRLSGCSAASRLGFGAGPSI
jgi:toxin ParE1/3/4